ncbi:Methionyl-tRNA formyltransferase, mitochondrial [Thelohanellus kitauei]|uniref:Methionyl-tRNA formyltransferase, mitochondrial n=1 Tax=Thelohanellus kitauei TaxID=669202 RepID=A0A0C2IZD6_THEKT|nr:Methionyl-tRNA formyltransferase, mitochondrial [Thelohanellus kitauei]
MANSILFFGTDPFYSLPVLQRLFQSRAYKLDVVIGKNIDTRKPLIDFARNNLLNIHEFDHLDPLVRYDFGVVASFGQLIPENIIKSFNKNILNVHPSYIPLYRGPNPIIRAMMDGSDTTGVTILEVSPNKSIFADAGMIVAEFFISAIYKYFVHS